MEEGLLESYSLGAWSTVDEREKLQSNEIPDLPTNKTERCAATVPGAATASETKFPPFGKTSFTLRLRDGADANSIL